ncbi:Arabinanase/levansucrase/invertase [Flagelloscypha sp. PMI_526]|nr:Arabinanase/levansucrase/invertase [Flagelloscypha sp. PMI_526]
MFWYLLASLTFLGHLNLICAFTNPIKTQDGSDPFMVYDKGYYYITASTWGNVQMARASTIAGLKNATWNIIWEDDTPSRACHFWAPEFHWIAEEDSWYIYYSSGSCDTYDNQRIHAIKGGCDLGNSTWTFAADIEVPDHPNQWFIDGSILQYARKRYLIFSMFDGDDQSLWIAPMSNSTTLSAAPVLFSRPNYDWEKHGLNVNEGPIAISRGKRQFVVYSASFCGGDSYQLGLLELVGNKDPMVASNWVKTPTPVFTAANGNNEPGHNGFFKSPSGKEDWIVYHASPDIPSSCGGARYTNIQKIGWTSDGSPDLGVPLPWSEEIPEPV